MKNIDWSKLSFSYTQTKALVYSRCIDGKWETPTVTENFNICLNSFAEYSITPLPASRD